MNETQTRGWEFAQEMADAAKENDRRRRPGARYVEVIEVTFLRGDGIEDPIRIVTAYYSAKGDLLAENDPVA